VPVYMAVSLIGAWLRTMPTTHLTLVRTMRIGLPQQMQFTTGRGPGGTTTRLISCTSLTSLLLGCRKPKLRARLNPFGGYAAGFAQERHAAQSAGFHLAGSLFW